jgi:hypothetical protein
VACNHGDPHRPALGIGNGVQPGVRATLGAPDLASAPPFSTRRLDAVRCALRCVASIMNVLCLAPSAAGPAMIRAKTPVSLQRFQGLQSANCAPVSQVECSLASPLAEAEPRHPRKISGS